MGSVVAQWTSIHHGRSRLSVHINIGLAACASVATASPIMVCIWFVSMTVRSSAPAAYGGSEVRGHEVISLLRICQTLPRLGSFINVMEYQRSNLSSGAWMHVVSSEQQACRSHNGVVTALLYIHRLHPQQRPWICIPSLKRTTRRALRRVLTKSILFTGVHAKDQRMKTATNVSPGLVLLCFPRSLFGCCISERLSHWKPESQPRLRPRSSSL